MKEPLLELKRITKRFGKIVANENISMQLFPGEIHAILGENGAGKSTLMNILTGIYKPNEGEIYYKGKKIKIRSPKQAVEIGIGMVHQHFRLIPTLTAAENIFLYLPDCKFFLKTKEMEEEIRKCSEQFQLQIDPSAKVWQLSVGEQQRVEILKLLYRGADILILDEPSSVLTAEEAKKMFQTLRHMAEQGKSIVVISHKMSEVMQFADRITVLKGGRVEDQMTAEEATVERLTKGVVGNRSMEFTRERRSFSDEKPVLEIKDLSVKNDRELMALKDVTFDIRPGEIFGIAGVAGNGQKELSEAIAGLRKVETGSITLNGEDLAKYSVKELIDKGISFIPEDRLGTGMVPDMDACSNRMLKTFSSRQFSKGGLIRKNEVKRVVEEEIETYEIKMAGFHNPISLMSGGNQQKLLVAREVSGEINLLIAAYPVRGLDIGATEAIHKILVEQSRKGVAVLLISEELSELFKLSDRIGVLCDGEMKAVLNVDEADYDIVGKLMTGEKYE